MEENYSIYLHFQTKPLMNILLQPFKTSGITKYTTIYLRMRDFGIHTNFSRLSMNSDLMRDNPASKVCDENA